MVLVMPRVLSTSDLVLYVRLRSLSARCGAPGSSLPVQHAWSISFYMMLYVLLAAALVLYVRLRSLSACWGAPRSSLPAQQCTWCQPTGSTGYCLLSTQETSASMMLHVSLAGTLVLCVFCTPPAVHQGLPCMGSVFKPFP